jgi:hypothetical protein
MEPQKTLLIVSCTRSADHEAFVKRPIYNSVKRLKQIHGDNIQFKVFRKSASKEGLSHCYNQVLHDPSNLDKIALFVHDDVVIDDMFLYEKLVNSPYSITGLAGATSFNKKNDNLAWHLCAPKEHHVGEVAHAHIDWRNNTTYWTSVFGKTTSRALVVDGLFICCNIKDVASKGLSFDERFKFHFYDLSFCLRANALQVKCGVLPIKVTHYGLGDSMLTEDWKKYNEEFRNAYCV